MAAQGLSLFLRPSRQGGGGAANCDERGEKTSQVLSRARKAWESGPDYTYHRQRIPLKFWLRILIFTDSFNRLSAREQLCHPGSDVAVAHQYFAHQNRPGAAGGEAFDVFAGANAAFGDQ